MDICVWVWLGCVHSCECRCLESPEEGELKKVKEMPDLGLKTELCSSAKAVLTETIGSLNL